MGTCEAEWGINVESIERVNASQQAPFYVTLSTFAQISTHQLDTLDQWQKHGLLHSNLIFTATFSTQPSYHSFVWVMNILHGGLDLL